MVESGDRMSSSGVDDHGKDGEQARPSPDQFIPTSSRYCPSRWLMAHHDTKANIYTLSSHMCLADLNNEDESLLALIDFKRGSGQQQSARLDSFGLARLPVPKAPYDCRLRVYRGQKLIYNHFLDDIPSCLFATTIKAPARASSPLNVLKESHQNQTTSGQSLPEERTLLTLAINDDVYFYHKLKASHKMSLEDNEIITNSLNRSEFEAWQMVRQNKVDVDTLRELLFSLSNELGSHQLTSHSNSFLALETNEDRKNYLLYWKLKKLSDGFGEHIMSMDSICCAAARLRSNSSITRSGDFGQTREHGAHLVNSSRWNKVMDFQKSGLIVGTEDRHLLIFELLSTRAILEAHHRLPSVPDHLLVERKSPSSIDSETNLKNLTYKILVSCRDCCIYCIDQTYLLSSATNKPVNNKGRSNLSPGANKVRKLLTLKCNVLDMCFTGDEPAIFEGISAPSFIVTCLDRRVYCFSSLDGHCKWMVELDMPATCLISLPIARLGGGGGGVSNESNLIGVASQANRIDFYTSHNGLIVDTIYLGSDNCQAMTFGRFGREDNCLCLVTSAGHLLIFILKRTARFANAQCLSSAAAHAADVLAACSHLPASVTRPLVGPTGQVSSSSSSSLSTVSTSNNKRMNLNKPASLPSAFSISKANSASVTDRGLDKLQSEHNCDEVIAKSTIDAHLKAPQLQVPIKGRDFVDHIVEQSRNSTATSKKFARQMAKLRDKIRSTIAQESDLAFERSDGNRLTLTRVTGLGNTYRVSLSLRLKLEEAQVQVRTATSAAANSHLLRGDNEEKQLTGVPKWPGEFGGAQNSNDLLIDRQTRAMSAFVFVANNTSARFCQVKPFRFDWLVSRRKQDEVENGEEESCLIVEKTIDMKLLLTGAANNNNNNLSDSEPISLNVYVLLSPKTEVVSVAKWPQASRFSVQPVFISSVNIATC